MPTAQNTPKINTQEVKRIILQDIESSMSANSDLSGLGCYGFECEYSLQLSLTVRNHVSALSIPGKIKVAQQAEPGETPEPLPDFRPVIEQWLTEHEEKEVDYEAVAGLIEKLRNSVLTVSGKITRGKQGGAGKDR